MQTEEFLVDAMQKNLRRKASQTHSGAHDSIYDVHKSCEYQDCIYRGITVSHQIGRARSLVIESEDEISRQSQLCRGYEPL